MLCLEQVGSRQAWTTSHRLFAHAVANLVTLALVEYEAAEARRQASQANERLKAVFDASRDALLLTDGESGVVLDANRQAETLFGCARHELVGKCQSQLHPEALASDAIRNFRQVVEGQLQADLISEIQCGDGSVRPVEITTEVADLSDGHVWRWRSFARSRSALGVYCGQGSGQFAQALFDVAACFQGVEIERAMDQAGQLARLVHDAVEFEMLSLVGDLGGFALQGVGIGWQDEQRIAHLLDAFAGFVGK